MKTVVLIPAEGQPRHWKRISLLKGLSTSLTVLGFVRKRFSIDTHMPDIVLSEIEDGKYVRRIWRFAMSLQALRSKTRECDLAYAFGIDMGYLMALALIGRKTCLVVEIGDIRESQLRTGFLGQVMRSLEGRLYRRVARVVVTSEAFYRGYMLGYLRDPPSTDRVITMHNWPIGSADVESRPSVRGIASNETVTIGWFGLLRCPLSLSILCMWASRDVERRTLVLAGRIDVPENLWLRMTVHENISYLGQYDGLTQLRDLYSQVDLIWAAYPLSGSTDGNWKWARTNRFFEGVYFGVPPITKRGTPDGDEAERLGLGPVIDCRSSVMDAVSLLEAINSGRIDQWKAKCQSRCSEPSKESAIFVDLIKEMQYT